MKTKQIIVPDRRGKGNDCFGYCIGCPQANSPAITTAHSDSGVEYIFCKLPFLHTVTFPYPKGRGKKIVVVPKQRGNKNE